MPSVRSDFSIDASTQSGTRLVRLSSILQAKDTPAVDGEGRLTVELVQQKLDKFMGQIRNMLEEVHVADSQPAGAAEHC